VIVRPCITKANKKKLANVAGPFRLTEKTVEYEGETVNRLFWSTFFFL
jgi:hypothetical protein